MFLFGPKSKNVCVFILELIIIITIGYSYQLYGYGLVVAVVGAAFLFLKLVCTPLSTRCLTLPYTFFSDQIKLIMHLLENISVIIADH